MASDDTTWQGRVTRRELLAGAARGSVLLALGGCVPGLFGPRALADGDGGGGAASAGGPALVVIELAGGNDGLNTLVPFQQDGYYRARPVLAIPRRDCLALDDAVGLHPALGGLKRLYDDGLVAVVQGVGYPGADRSHFRAMEIWHTARPDMPADSERTGWLGRYLDEAGPGASGGALPAVAFGREVPRALSAARAVVPAVDDPAQFGLQFEGEQGRVLEALLKDTCEAGAGAGIGAAAGMDGAPAAPDAALGAVRGAIRGALLTSADMHRLADGYKASADYPVTQLGRGLRYVAHMLALGFQTRVFYLGMGGFDTHAAQPGRHRALLADVGGAIEAFLTDVRRQRFEREVLVLVFSEFGRRVAENASAGTDHGTAGPVILCGAPVRPGLCGAHPSLERLGGDDPAYGIDFRRIYATLLDDYLGLAGRSARILGGRFDGLPLLR